MVQSYQATSAVLLLTGLGPLACYRTQAVRLRDSSIAKGGPKFFPRGLLRAKTPERAHNPDPRDENGNAGRTR